MRKLLLSLLTVALLTNNAQSCTTTAVNLVKADLAMVGFYLRSKIDTIKAKYSQSKQFTTTDSFDFSGVDNTILKKITYGWANTTESCDLSDPQAKSTSQLTGCLVNYPGDSFTPAHDLSDHFLIEVELKPGRADYSNKKILFAAYDTSGTLIKKSLIGTALGESMGTIGFFTCYNVDCVVNNGCRVAASCDNQTSTYLQCGKDYYSDRDSELIQCFQSQFTAGVTMVCPS